MTQQQLAQIIADIIGSRDGTEITVRYEEGRTDDERHYL